MEDLPLLTTAHPLGELFNDDVSHLKNEDIQCDTFSGLVHVEWDEQAPVTPMGQLVFFTQFLKTCNLYGPWVQECPLKYTSPNAPSKFIVISLQSKHLFAF